MPVLPPNADSHRPPGAARVHRTLTILVEEDLFLDDRGRWGWNALPRRIRGRSRDRIDSLAERWVERTASARLEPTELERLRQARAEGWDLHLESGAPEPVVRALARYLQAARYSGRPLEFRSGRATGRILPGPVETSLVPHPAPPPAVQVSSGGTGPATRSARRALAGRRILLVGFSGFIGKVWVASLLRHVPEIGRLTLLVRARSEIAPEARFRRTVAESPVFASLREEPGGLDRLVSGKLEVVEGDITRPGLGLAPEIASRLESEIDLVVSCAGLTEFNPDLRDALAVNVDGTLHLLEFTRSCRQAALLHVSTCYVAGEREGRIPESLDPERTPAGGERFDPEAEWSDLGRLVEQTVTRRGAVRRTLIEAGVARARARGWPNIYTYTKALGESLLALRAGPVPFTVVRPSIVESARDFPLAGWNEGINTSCPLSHLLGTAFRQLPVNDRKRLDVIPVDTVARGLTLIAAALAERRHDPVYQLATSSSNPLDLARAVELTALAHGLHYRTVGGFKERVLARLEAVPVSRERYERFSVPRLLRIAQRLNRIVGAKVPGKRHLVRAERTLRRIRELIDLYEPFLLDQEPIFEADRIEALSAALPEEERNDFAWDVRNLDWHDYWIRVHIPGLRRWSYPLLERREGARPSTPARKKTPEVVAP